MMCSSTRIPSRIRRLGILVEICRLEKWENSRNSWKLRENRKKFQKNGKNSRKMGKNSKKFQKNGKNSRKMGRIPENSRKMEKFLENSRKKEQMKVISLFKTEETKVDWLVKQKTNSNY